MLMWETTSKSLLRRPCAGILQTQTSNSWGRTQWDHFPIFPLWYPSSCCFICWLKKIMVIGRLFRPSGVERCHWSLSGPRTRSRGMFLPLHIRAWFQKYHQHQEGQGDWAWLGRGNMWWNLPLSLYWKTSWSDTWSSYIYIHTSIWFYMYVYI